MLLQYTCRRESVVTQTLLQSYKSHTLTQHTLHSTQHTKTSFFLPYSSLFSYRPPLCSRTHPGGSSPRTVGTQRTCGQAPERVPEHRRTETAMCVSAITYHGINTPFIDFESFTSSLPPPYSPRTPPVPPPCSPLTLGLPVDPLV